MSIKTKAQKKMALWALTVTLKLEDFIVWLKYKLWALESIEKTAIANALHTEANEVEKAAQDKLSRAHKAHADAKDGLAIANKEVNEAKAEAKSIRKQAAVYG